MNLLHLKYVVEVYQTKSFTKAAENLYMGQPNLSRAIKELEQSLGITIFRRTSRGIEITEAGEEFVHYAKKILQEVDVVEKRYTQQEVPKEKFSILVPRASYIGSAFVAFMRKIDANKHMDITYKETNSLKALDKVLKGEYRLGIIRYRSCFDHAFKQMFEEKGLNYELISEFQYQLVVHQDHPLTKLEKVTCEDLNQYIEICHPDPYVPNIPFYDVKKIEFSESIHRRISVYERASQFDLLENLPNTFMWVSPIPQKLMEKYNLVELICEEHSNKYKDVLIFRKGYHLTPIDNQFLTVLCQVKREILKE